MPWGVAIAAGVGLVGSSMAANSQEDAANTAASAQNSASSASIAQQNKQFEALQALLSPYSNAGTSSLAAQQNILGLNGNSAQQSAIGGIQNSAQFGMLKAQGENSILQNAAATGGIRGGNVQSSLAQFSPQLLNSLVQQQYSNLGGITSIGQNAAAGTGNAGMQNANQISSLLQSQGAANAGAALASGQATAGMYNSFGSGLGTLAGSGAFSNLFGGATSSGISGIHSDTIANNPRF